MVRTEQGVDDGHRWAAGWRWMAVARPHGECAHVAVYRVVTSHDEGIRIEAADGSGPTADIAMGAVYFRSIAGRQLSGRRGFIGLHWSDDFESVGAPYAAMREMAALARLVACAVLGVPPLPSDADVAVLTSDGDGGDG